MLHTRELGLNLNIPTDILTLLRNRLDLTSFLNTTSPPGPASSSSGTSSPSSTAIVGNGNSSNTPAGAIAGGVIGGLVLVLALVGLWFGYHRRHQNQMRKTTDPEPFMEPKEGSESGALSFTAPLPSNVSRNSASTVDQVYNHVIQISAPPVTPSRSSKLSPIILSPPLTTTETGSSPALTSESRGESEDGSLQRMVRPRGAAAAEIPGSPLEQQMRALHREVQGIRSQIFASPPQYME